MTVQDLFDQLLRSIPNTEGFFNTLNLTPEQMVNHPNVPKLAIGQIVRVFNQRIVLVGTRLNNFVVYQTDNEHQPVKYACSQFLDLVLQLPEMHLSFHDFNRLFYPGNNVGLWVEDVFRILQVSENGGIIQ